MPKTNLEKVRECIEILEKGVFTKWEDNFLIDMEVKLMNPRFRPSPKQQKKINELYDKACASPY